MKNKLKILLGIFITLGIWGGTLTIFYFIAIKLIAFFAYLLMYA